MSTSTLSHSIFAITTLALLTAACSAGSPEEVTTSDDALAGTTPGAAAQAACGSAFAPALVHYKAAVANAKARLSGTEVCATQGEAIDGTLWAIAAEATAAVMVCPAFKTVIKDSPFAEPIRATLASSLTLRSLTGELLVLRDSPFANWRGVELLLPGTRFEGDSFGTAKLDLGPDGTATWTDTEILDHAPWSETRTTPATYTVEKTGGEKAPRRLSIVLEGRVRRFDLAVTNPVAEDYPSPPDLVLREIDGGHDSARLWSLPSECSH